MVQAREEELIDYPVIRYVSEKDSFVDDHKYTSMECYLDIYLNGKRFTTSFCSPGDHTDLVIGIMAQMGQIRTYAAGRGRDDGGGTGMGRRQCDRPALFPRP